ncbi:MAG: acyl-CoA dehydrogenase family protein [Chloroflexota bacterium]
MDFRFTEEQSKFRQEVRDFLEAEIRQDAFKPAIDAWMRGRSPEFSRKLAQKGWIGMTWPKACGGQGRSYLDRIVLTEELLNYGAPTACHMSADRQMGPSIIAHGSDEQKKKFLPPIVRGESYYCIATSEPEAGSDAVSIKTRAARDGDSYIVNGQKIWTSRAQHAHYFYLTAVTDPQAKRKHQGISEFVVPTNLPGITIKPIRDMTGGEHFNEVFFDNVRVPGDCLIGQENRGFYQIMSQLDFERSGLERLMSNYILFKGIVQYAKETLRSGRPLCKDPDVRRKLADLEMEFHVGRLLIYRVAWLLDQKKAPTMESALAKLHGNRFEKRLANTAVEILGLYGQLTAGSKHVPLEGNAVESFLFAPGYSIQAGTTEVLKNIVAGRGLELPRE